MYFTIGFDPKEKVADIVGFSPQHVLLPTHFPFRASFRVDTPATDIEDWARSCGLSQADAVGMVAALTEKFEKEFPV